MAEARILVAATSATFDYQGQPVWLTQNRTTVREGHPITRGREHLFKPLVVDFEAEQAPAAKPPARGAQPATKPPAAARTAPGTAGQKN